jgi:hypothetical protein
MDKWMDGRVDRYIYGWMDGWKLDSYMDRQITYLDKDKWIVKTDEWIHGWINGQIDIWIY